MDNWPYIEVYFKTEIKNKYDYEKLLITLESSTNFVVKRTQSSARTLDNYQ